MASKEALAKAFRQFSAVFDREVTEDMFDAYMLALSDVTDGELAGASQRAIQSARRFPVPAEIREAAGKKTSQPTGKMKMPPGYLDRYR